jgi:DNA-binding response OmpR family regulator
MNANGHILIVDDEAPLRQTMARVLQRAGFSATTVASAQEGLSLLETQTVDMMYLDIRMPDMNGLEMLKIVHAKYPELPVILFTAQPDLNSAVSALRQGATDYLMKPLKPQTLTERTQAILTRREKEKRKREIQAQIQALQSELRALDDATETTREPTQDAPKSPDRYLTRGKLTLDLHSHRVAIGDKIINLPPTAFDYLLVLARHSPNIVNYQTLIAEAQGYQADFREAQELVKWHIHHIRQALEPDARNPIYLLNARGTGYRLVAD